MNMTDMPPGFLRTSIQTDQLMPALAEARAEIGAVEKQGYNEHHKYAYTKLEDVIVAIAPALNKHGLAVSGSITDFKIPEKKENLVIVSMTHRLTHVKSGQWIEADAIGSGADSQDKAAYKAMTGARKYGLCMLLNLMTDHRRVREDRRWARAHQHVPALPDLRRRRRQRRQQAARHPQEHQSRHQEGQRGL
jgi:hypothetical protein